MHHPIDLPDTTFIRRTDPQALSAGSQASVVAIGNFDGVHRGHQRVLQQAVAMAAEIGGRAAVLTFAPHPRRFFQPEAPHFVLTPPDVQAALVQQAGIDAIYTLTFDAALASLSADAFIHDILVGRLGVKGIVVGWDFHFGKGRAGTVATLEASDAGFKVEAISPLADGTGVFSSSRIRQDLTNGSVAAANATLGYEWFVRGPVIHGEKRGRDLGYPTANMRLDVNCGLQHGIYAVRAYIDGKTYGAVASFGRRPTFDNGAPLLETHVFDFAGDLYGKTMDVAFVTHLRPELKFDSTEALVVQMNEDSARARLLTKDAAPRL